MKYKCIVFTKLENEHAAKLQSYIRNNDYLERIDKRIIWLHDLPIKKVLKQYQNSNHDNSTPGIDMGCNRVLIGSGPLNADSDEPDLVALLNKGSGA